LEGTALLERIVPAGVVTSEAFDDSHDIVLFPAEAEIVSRSVDKRRREFATARWCAREALAGLGLPPSPILPGEHGAPRWPDGVAGAITHCAGYRGVALARTSDVAMLGLDAEPNGPLPDGVLDAIALPPERVWVRELLVAEPKVRWDRLLFSMKESVYKAWFPATGVRLDFEDALITVDSAASTFSAKILVPGRVRDVLGGRWLAEDGLLVTAIVVPR
jgi:4'-phosphopantetheinyl transferase EntD